MISYSLIDVTWHNILALIYLFESKEDFEGSKMELTYFDDRFGISTIKHFEISLRILV